MITKHIEADRHEPVHNGPRPTRQWWRLVKTAASAWVDDYAPSMGAALSYYSVFSLAPLLLIVISIAGLVFGQEAVRGSKRVPALATAERLGPRWSRNMLLNKWLEYCVDRGHRFGAVHG